MGVDPRCDVPYTPDPLPPVPFLLFLLILLAQLPVLVVAAAVLEHPVQEAAEAAEEAAEEVAEAAEEAAEETEDAIDKKKGCSQGGAAPSGLSLLVLLGLAGIVRRRA